MSIDKKPFQVDLSEKVAEILNQNIVNRHSYFQLKYFVLGKEYTTQSRLWCCIKEIQARAESRDAMCREIEDTDDNIALLKIERERMEAKRVRSPLNKQEKEIRLRKVDRRIAAAADNLTKLHSRLKETQEEMAFFANAFCQLEKVEPLKPFDDFESQNQYWNEKLSQEINLRLLLRNPLDAELMKTVLALKDGTPIKQTALDILDNSRQQAITEHNLEQQVAQEE